MVKALIVKLIYLLFVLFMKGHHGLAISEVSLLTFPSYYLHSLQSIDMYNVLM
jgi:hypothetical protein